MTDKCPTVPAVVALSGGGIRAAAFALGAFNALQEAAKDQKPRPAAPRIVAVSGGSYTAAALALVRTFDHGGEQRRRSLGWTEAYELGSPELTRLRRHTRDLVEPRRELVQGVFTLLSGAVVNLVMVLAALRFASWVLGWFYAVSGAFVAPGATVDKGGATELTLSPLWTLPWMSTGNLLPWQRPGIYWVVWAPVVVATVAAVVLSLVIWGRQHAADDGDHVSAAELQQLTTVSGLRVLLVGAMAAWVVLSAGLPTVLYGVGRLALDNSPNPTTAAVVRTLGLTTAPMCADATKRRLEAGYAELSDQARLNPGAAQTRELGACGSTVKVSITFPPAVGSDPAAAQLQRLLAVGGANSPSSDLDAASQATTLTVVLSAIGFALRKAGKTVDSAALTGFRGRVRRLLLARLPLAIIALTGLWLLMAWTFRLTVDERGRGAGGQVVWMLLGLGAAVWCNANTMSLHSYYRRRLSNAFAAGRNDTSKTADVLPFHEVYGFSAIRDDFLHVVTTANVRTYDETATRRGGLPFVFSPNRICWARTDREPVTRPTDCYEQAAGPGRVSVMAAVAMSGAAVGPLAGRYASRVAPYRMLLTLFNVRVGSWVINPAWTADQPVRRSSRWTAFKRWPTTPWLISRPGAAQVLHEAVGRSSVRDRWLYLSDGGHLDNTGLVEAVRLWKHGTELRQTRVLVVDASNDVTGSWSAVGDALAVVRADLDVELERMEEPTALAVEPDDAAAVPADPWWRRRLRAWLVPDPPARAAPDDMRRYRGSFLDRHIEVVVVKAVRPVKLDKLPEPVRCFASANPDFPRASTVRQDFGDLEFEAYRALGEFSTKSALERWPEPAATRSAGAS